MKSALIDFHSLVTIWAPQLTDGVRAFIWRQFPLFFRQEVPEPPPHPDIILQPMGDLPPITDTNRRISALYGFSIFDYHGEFAVGLLHKRLPDILIMLSDPLKIIYRPRAGNQGRLYGVLLFGIQLCLKRKSALLAHGAVVEKNGQTLLIAGHRGSGKTQLLLTLLRRGWNYLSDDKFILHRGTAYLFESRIYINDHLFSCLPWLRTIVPATRLQQSATLLRRTLRPLAYGILQRRSPFRLERLLDPAVQYDVETLLSSCSLRVQAVPAHGFLLFHGRHFSIEEISRNSAITRLSSIEHLLFADTDTMEKMLSLYTGVDCEPLQNLVGLNLPDIPFYKVVIPEMPDLEGACQEILKCCEAQL